MRYKSEMTRDDIIRMAREAELVVIDDIVHGIRWYQGVCGFNLAELERFAALVAAAERERVTFELVNEAQRAIQEAVWAEREACAKMCEDWPTDDEYVYSIGVAIRARGEE